MGKLRLRVFKLLPQIVTGDECWCGDLGQGLASPRVCALLHDELGDSCHLHEEQGYAIPFRL